MPEYFYDVNPDEFAYISLLTKKTYGPGTELKLNCSFEGTGAPLIAFTADINDAGEHRLYGLHYEVVAYADGCNIWKIRPAVEEKEWGIDPTLLFEDHYAIEEKTPVEIIVRFGENGHIDAAVNGKWTSLDMPGLPEQLHVGFTSCEGINHFTKFTITTSK